jgi:murein L,D-transpeptidase YcbB/YkuD
VIARSALSPRLRAVVVGFCLATVPPAGTTAGSSDSQPPAGGSVPRQPASAIQLAIGRGIAGGSGWPVRRLTAAERRDLDRLYGTAAPPLWLTTPGAPNHAAREGLRLLSAAADEGLDPADYDAVALAHACDALPAPGPMAAENQAAFDVALSAALLRYFRHVHLGRVDPQAIGFRVRLPTEEHDFVAVLRSAIAGDRVAETAADLAPPLIQYRALRTALARYRALAAAAGVTGLPALPATVHPGDPYPDVTALGRELRALGDLPADADMNSNERSGRYEGPLVTAVERFQVRHGLTPDGVLGPATRAALRVPLTWRIRQIELALERLRWLPDLGRQRFIALNIPMFTFWAWDSIPPAGTPAFGMRAIVGRALNTQTPLFVEEMRYVIFRPYWNVPRSILRNEILPALSRDPGYLERHDMEIVREAGGGRPEPDTIANQALLKQGVLGVRQRPGPRNSLGLVKFVFPNDANVYMHGTPAQELFSRSRRDFSHGCVRVEHPAALAEWVLKHEPGWTSDRILAAMAGATPTRVDLADPILVILFYITAVVMPEDGGIHFAEDIYRHDLRLDRALTESHGGR